MLNKNKILMITVMGAIAGMSSGAKAQTFYQCLPCGEGTFYYEGKCYKKCPSGYFFDYDALKCRRDRCEKMFTLGQFQRNIMDFFICYNDIEFGKYRTYDFKNYRVTCEDFEEINHMYLTEFGYNCGDYKDSYKCLVRLHWNDNSISYKENNEEIKEWRCEEYLEE